MNENSLKNLKPFQKGQSGNPKGRPPDQFVRFIHDLEKSMKKQKKDEIREAKLKKRDAKKLGMNPADVDVPVEVDWNLEPVNVDDLKTKIKWLLNLPDEALMMVMKSNDPRVPSLIITFASTIYGLRMSGRITSLIKLLEWVFGRPAQQIEANVNTKVENQDVDLDKYPPQVREQILALAGMYLDMKQEEENKEIDDEE